MLLVGGQAPGLPGYPLYRLKLQGRYAGYQVDDFIAFGRDPGTGREAKLLAQIKHQAAVTGGNAVFGDVLAAAWHDFNAPAFDASVDALALITGPLSAADTHHVRPLLEWARHSADEREFLDKVATDNFSSDDKRAKLDVFREHLKRANGNTDVSDLKLWSFLKRFHLIGYDLDVEEGSTPALLRALISQASDEPPVLLWSRLVDAVQTANQNAGTVTVETLPAELRHSVRPGANTRWTQDVDRLEEHGRRILGSVRMDIGGVHIDQRATLARLQALAEESRFVWVTGPRGAGKSSLVRSMAQQLGQDAQVFCLRTEDLNQPGLMQVFTSLGLNHSLGALGASLALLPKKFLFIESLEKLLELEHQEAFRDLLQFLNTDPGWTVIASGRSYAAQQIAFTFLQPEGVFPAVLTLSGFTEAQVEELCQSQAALQAFAANPVLKALLTNPFLADLAYRVTGSGTSFAAGDGEREFRLAVWRDVIAKESVRGHGLPARRRATFVQVAVQRAKRMVYGVPAGEFDAEAIARLEEDHLLVRNGRTQQVSPAHDVLEDWALEAFIDEAYGRHGDDLRAFLQAVGNEPAMNRAFRHWLQRRLHDEPGADDLVLDLLTHPDVERYWQDEAITAVLQGDGALAFLCRVEARLFAAEGELFSRCCFLLRVACQMPRFDGMFGMDAGLMTGSFSFPLRPVGPGWSALIRFALERRTLLPEAWRPHLTAVLKDWSSAVNVEDPPGALARDVGLLALHLIEPLKRAYRADPVRTSLLDTILWVSTAIPDEVAALVEQDVLSLPRHRDRPDYADDLIEKMLLLPGVAMVSRTQPELIIRLAWNEWIAPAGSENGWQDSHTDVEGHFGLRNSRQDFYPASGAKGPFIYLLNRHGFTGLNFIVQLCNHAAERYAHSSLEQGMSARSRGPDGTIQPVDQIDLRFDDGGVVRQYVSARLWLGYRGHAAIPEVLQCALMALENYLIALVEQADTPDALSAVEQICTSILRTSNSVLTTAVLASVATGFPEQLGRAALPLLRHAALYPLDRNRRIHERGAGEANWFAYGHDALGPLYAQERRTAALRPWRQRHLEHLITHLQFSDLRPEAYAAVDDLRAASTGSESERFLLHRVDTRAWTARPGPEPGQMILTTPEVEPDLAELTRVHLQEQQLMARFSALFVWSTNTFKREIGESDLYPTWREALAETQALWAEVEEDDPVRVLHMGALITTAAVVLRDHSSELTNAEARWCAEVCASAVLHGADLDDHLDGGGATDLEGVHAAATILPLALDLAQDDAARLRARQHIVTGLTHSTWSVRLAVAEGVRLHLWRRDPAFAERCIRGMLAFSRFERERRDEERQLRSADADDQFVAAQERQRLKNTFRVAFLQGDFDTAETELSPLAPTADDLIAAALMIPDGSIQAQHVHLLTQLLLVLFENEEQQDRRVRRQDRIEPSPKQRTRFIGRFVKYLLGLEHGDFQPFTALLKQGCERAPSLLQAILLRMAVDTERPDRKALYWRFWNTIAPTVQGIAVRAASENEQHQKLMRSLLCVDVDWQPVDHENQNIGQGKPFLMAFFEQAGMNPDVFEGLAALMYHFPSIFFEDGVHVLAFWQGTSQAPPIGGNSAFYVERAIQRYLHVDHPGPISRRMYEACLTLLSKVVETASARAYYLREQLVRSRRVA